MSQLEYGDYYKFAASAGIALLVAAGLLPWAFLNESFDLTLEASKIALLTPEAQSLIYTRQHLVALFVNIVPWASGALALAGVFLTGYGLLKWRIRQILRDQGEDADVQKKLKDMSPAEVVKSSLDDAESLEEPPSHALTAPLSPPADNPFLAAERTVLARIQECYGSSAKCNQRLGRVEYDAIIRAGESGRIILEIKYIRKGFRQGWLTENLNALAARTQLYSNTFSQNAHGVLLIVLAKESQSLTSPIADASAKALDTRSSRFNNLRIRTLQEAQVSTISCSDLKHLLN
jgi:hypothetical protein